MCKRELGQYFTKNDIWVKPQVREFIENSNASLVVDPFCGNGDLLNVAKELGCSNVKGYDIDNTLDWNVNDSLKHIEKVNGLILTNPPYLAKSSANRRKLETYGYFKGNNYSDLYQIALEKILDSADKAVVIIPESYLLTNLFFDRLSSITVIEDNPFEDTECPVCVACFDEEVKDSHWVKIYKNNEYVMTLEELLSLKKVPHYMHKMTFNDKQGNLGIRCVDGISGGSQICFTTPDNLNYDLDRVKQHSRFITVVNLHTDKPLDRVITQSNHILQKYRKDTKDLLLCPFMGNTKDNVRRRRLDFTTARAIIEEAIDTI